MSLRPGDQLTLSRSGKVFLTQYTSVEGFASLTRTLGDDPAADITDMQETLNALWSASVLENFAKVDAANEALGTERDLDALLAHLESHAITTATPGPSQQPERRAKRSSKKRSTKKRSTKKRTGKKVARRG